MSQLHAVLNALNTVSISGKANIANLGGSINMIETVIHELDQCECSSRKDDA